MEIHRLGGAPGLGPSAQRRGELGGCSLHIQFVTSLGCCRDIKNIFIYIYIYIYCILIMFVHIAHVTM